MAEHIASVHCHFLVSNGTETQTMGPLAHGGDISILKNYSSRQLVLAVGNREVYIDCQLVQSLAIGSVGSLNLTV